MQENKQNRLLPRDVAILVTFVAVAALSTGVACWGFALVILFLEGAKVLTSIEFVSIEFVLFLCGTALLPAAYVWLRRERRADLRRWAIRAAALVLCVWVVLLIYAVIEEYEGKQIAAFIVAVMALTLGCLWRIVRHWRKQSWLPQTQESDAMQGPRVFDRARPVLRKWHIFLLLASVAVLFAVGTTSGGLVERTVEFVVSLPIALIEAALLAGLVWLLLGRMLRSLTKFQYSVIGLALVAAIQLGLHLQRMSVMRDLQRLGVTPTDLSDLGGRPIRPPKGFTLDPSQPTVPSSSIPAPPEQLNLDGFDVQLDPPTIPLKNGVLKPFDALAEARQRYTALSDWDDARMMQNLNDPDRFRSAFPKYRHLDNGTILKYMARYTEWHRKKVKHDDK